MKKARHGRAKGEEVAGIYVRVSLDRRAKGLTDEMVSPDTQEDRARAYCASQGWPVVMLESDIDESGYKQHFSKRRGLMQLLEAVKRGEITKIVVFKFNRLSRRVREFLEICDQAEAVGAGVTSITEQIDTSTPGGRMIRNVMASFAQYQSEELSEQISESWITKAKRGERPPGIAPFGTINQRGILAPDPATHPHLVAMFEVLKTTESLRLVWDYLSSRQVPPPRAKEWHLITIKKILSNPIYVGDMAWVDNTFKGNWEPLVPLPLWQDVQGILTKRSTGPNARRDARLLTGFIVCAQCGLPMWTQYKRVVDNGVSRLERTYHCESRHSRRNGCDIPNVAADEVEAASWSSFLQLISLVSISAFAPPLDDSDFGKRQPLSAQRSDIEEAVRELFDMLDKKDITREQFRDQNKRYMAQLSAIESELNRLSSLDPGPNLDIIQSAIKRAPLAISGQDQRAVLLALQPRIAVTGTTVTMELAGFSKSLKARRLGGTFHFGPDYQRLDYQGFTLTDQQVKFLCRTYNWADKKKIAQRLGKSYKALVSVAMKLRREGILKIHTKPI